MKLTEKQYQIINEFGYVSEVDFLNHFPSRYDLLQTKPIETWQTGDSIVFHGFLEQSFVTRRLGGKRSMTKFRVNDGVNSVDVTIFNRPYLKEIYYKEGITVIGTVDKFGGLSAKSVNSKSLSENLGISVQYPLKSGVKNFEIAKIIEKILTNQKLEDIIPLTFIKQYRLLQRGLAMKFIHKPTSFDEISLGARTLKYEEFLRYHLTLALDADSLGSGRSHARSVFDLNKQKNKLPYVLTKDQDSALNEIVFDLKSTKKMQRLLQGDVGSGKTIVSFMSAIAAIEAGYQVAFLVPTEILLQQHVASFMKLYPEIECVSLSLASDNKTEVNSKITSGSVKMIFGTHSLFSESVTYHNLGYVIIDEQHRFGVEQRRKLLEKGEDVDLLMLSATPIPRTLANALYFNLEVSTISTYPASRKQIKTKVIEENSIRSITDIIKRKLAKGEQVYVVCPAIENDERVGVRNVDEIYENLSKVFVEYSVGKLHGQMKSSEKDEVMSKFVANEIGLLVTTTVIEVGVDVHNANTMIIYNGELFGLATLHQLRGRVGRGSIQGECYILSNSNDDMARNRLKALEDTNDGFVLSMQDMRNRGIGDALGTRQSGLPSFILGDIEKDIKILNQAKIDAHKIALDRSNDDYKKIIESLSPQDYNKII